jgi:hemolysin activation/secretion protein
MFCIAAGNLIADDIVEPTKTEAQLKLEEKAKEQKKEDKKISTRKISSEEISKLNLPLDTSSLMTAKEVRISGNAVMSTEELLKDVPSVYNASDKPLLKADSESLFDFRVIQDLIAQPGPARRISARTIRGFVQYILSVYQDNDYAGIFVYVPTEVLEDNKLKDEVLVIKVIEATVASVTTNYYTPENEKSEKSYLDDSA